MKKLIAIFDHLLRSVIILSIAAMLLIICLQIFCRFLLNNALSWPEEAARFLMIWSLFLAAGYAMRNGEHVGLYFFIDRLPQKAARVVNIGTHLLIMVFLGVIVAGGIQEVMILMPMKTGALRISRAVPYLILPVSGLFFLLICGRIILEDIRKLRLK